MGTCCCHQRSKFDVDFQLTPEPAEDERVHLRLLNQLPTYENMLAAYDCLAHESSGALELLPHRKERMFCMIINLLRIRPALAFADQITAFKARCDLRQSAARGLLVFAPSDVDAAVDVLCS